MKISIVSPHRDDACFSLGVSLVRWARAGHRIRIVNCFTRSTYAPFSDADTVHVNDRMSYVSAIREREDEAFLRHVPASEMVDLRLKDAPIRLRCDLSEICTRSVEESDPAIGKIVAALEKRIRPDQADILLLPLGIGHHVDHSTVREACLSFAERLPCAFYEDLPYATRPGAEEEADVLRSAIATRSGLNLVPMVCRDGLSAMSLKRRLAQIYASQIDEAGADAMALFAKHYGGGERIWANERLAAMESAGISGWSAESVH